ncbi:MAG: FHA domain-containing protein, partial [Deltaproteobacteria bacterium]
MPSYTLLVQRVGRPDEEVTFDKPTIVIGREAGDLVMGDGQVSSRHAEISYRQGKLVFQDLGSTNGSFREDGQRIVGPIELAIGQSVRLGQCRITVRGIEGATAPGRTVVAGGPPRAPRGTMMMTPGQIPPPGARRPAPPPAGHAPPPPAGHA